VSQVTGLQDPERSVEPGSGPAAFPGASTSVGVVDAETDAAQPDRDRQQHQQRHEARLGPAILAPRSFRRRSAPRNRPMNNFVFR